jgi:hypothetical protein
MKSHTWASWGRWRAFVLACAWLVAACQTKYEGASVRRSDNYASGPYSYSIFVKLDFYGQDPRDKAETIMHEACPLDSPVLIDAQTTRISGTSSSKTFLIAYFTCKQLIPGAE